MRSSQAASSRALRAIIGPSDRSLTEGGRLKAMADGIEREAARSSPRPLYGRAVAVPAKDWLRRWPGFSDPYFSE